MCTLIWHTVHFWFWPITHTHNSQTKAQPSQNPGNKALLLITNTADHHPCIKLPNPAHNLSMQLTVGSQLQKGVPTTLGLCLRLTLPLLLSCKPSLTQATPHQGGTQRLRYLTLSWNIIQPSASLANITGWFCALRTPSLLSKSRTFSFRRHGNWPAWITKRNYMQTELSTMSWVLLCPLQIIFDTCQYAPQTHRWSSMAAKFMGKSRGMPGWPLHSNMAWHLATL